MMTKTEELMQKQMKRINIVEGSPRQRDNKKKRATKRESDVQLPGAEAEQVKEAFKKSGERQKSPKAKAEEGQQDSAVPAGPEEVRDGGISPLAKRKMKVGIDTKRHTLSYPLKEAFSETLDGIVARMPAHLRDRVMMK